MATYLEILQDALRLTQISLCVSPFFISVRASDADLWDTFVMSEEEELWFSLFSLENLATKC